jgi:anti-sigma factor RsiW
MDHIAERHLTDAELFGLAVPAAGEPEALPRHLSECHACARSLQEWKASVRALADEEVEELDGRSAEEWNAAAESTMTAIRRAEKPGRALRPLRWALGIAASLLIVALAIPRRSAAPASPAAMAEGASDSSLSAADREDDRLLRDVAFLAQGDDTSGALIGEGSL